MSSATVPNTNVPTFARDSNSGNISSYSCFERQATLVYVGDDVERRDARENAFEFSSTLSGASVTLGGNPISFAPHSPQVTVSA